MKLSDALISKLVEERTGELNQAIKERGYETLRTSIIKKQGERMVPWQIRIDYDPENNDYPVYTVDHTSKLPNIVPHYNYFVFAKEEFLDLLDDMVACNRQLVAENKEPLYHSPLWDTE